MQLITLPTLEEYYSHAGALLASNVRFIGTTANLTLVIYKEIDHG
jgi:hypothetical protein